MLVLMAGSRSSGPSPAPPEVSRLIRYVLGPVRALVQPHFLGLEHVPTQGPVLLVANHTLGGLYDVPFLWAELHERLGVALKILGDHTHFLMPGWRELLGRYGVVRGTPDNLRRLFSLGEHVLVFPGGGRELAKRRGEAYRLVWKERVGFARLAIAQGVPIVPVAAVGVEHALDVVVDAGDYLKSPLGRALRAVLKERAEDLPPIIKGIGPTPIPRPERLYFRFGPPVPTAHLRGQESSAAVVRAVRDEVKAAVEGQLVELLALRQADPRRKLLPRLARALGLGRGRSSL
jgi:1-acyl-sn-glycerol-3-phosphate acyltransferase